MLKKRVITALWGIPLLIVVVWFEKPVPWFTVLIAIWGVLAVFEFYRLVAASKVLPLTYFGLVWTLLLIISPHCSYTETLPLLLSSAVILPLVWFLVQKQKEEAFTRWAWTLAGILYMGWLLSYLVALRGLDDGRNWIFFTLFVTFASDTAAFFIGRAFGRHKLAPQISPGKTREGAVGGIFGAILVSLFFILPTPFILPITWWQAVLLGLLVSIFSQIGDLAESLFKRNMEAKDSGKLLPGHGGLLDRIDSVVFAGVVVYYYVVWMIQ
jgi:phosphatidate cytidylyltransferase